MKNNRITLINVITNAMKLSPSLFNVLANAVKLEGVENPVGLRDNLVEWVGLYPIPPAVVMPDLIRYPFEVLRTINKWLPCVCTE